MYMKMCRLCVKLLSFLVSCWMSWLRMLYVSIVGIVMISLNVVMISVLLIGFVMFLICVCLFVVMLLSV